MASYRVRVRVPEDRRITLQLPDEIPPGEAEVTVAAEGLPPARGSGERLLAWMRSREPKPEGYQARTKERIDTELRALRAEWDR